LYALTPGRTDFEVWFAQVEAALAAGLRLLQYRDKSVAREVRVARAKRLLTACGQYNATFIVNDDPALAAEVDAHGVHLGRDDATIEAARHVVGEHAIIGVSCYDDLDRALRLRAQGADYVAFGSFFASSVKPGAVRPDLGLLRRASAALDCPIVAIGGITVNDAPLVREAGAHAVAVITDVFSAPDIGTRVRDFGRLFVHAATTD